MLQLSLTLYPFIGYENYKQVCPKSGVIVPVQMAA